ncbi:Pwp1 rRNA processing protein [Metschnikowia bicuspidata]|uniref:Pwp1 rRNA processing protein n=1 Tax=Metschnikowia bicuspidata TaxID=27322 RepID=A0A4P9ZAR6_9ASCO|nr:Pwp1 rRNA processing protein [Metschnikowia bicuspidata]
MISSTCWVPRGFASEFPEQYELDDAEMKRISKMAQLELANAREDLANAQADSEPVPLPEQQQQESHMVAEELKEYDLENYDNEPVGGPLAAFIPGLSNTEAELHNDEDGDQYLSLPTETELQEDKREWQIYPTDNLLLATRTEDAVLYLDVYVYDDGAGAPDGAEEEEGDKFDEDVARGMARESNLYVHHDLMLPSFPLCVEWVNFRPGSAADDNDNNVGNFAAIGTFEPQIEVWNLDCLEKSFPDMILGEPPQNSFAAMPKKKTKSKAHVTTHHTDAVLSLAHSKTHRNVLASTSADTTVKLWDLFSGSAVRSVEKMHHGKIVASSQWHSLEASILLTGGYDGACAISDVRVSDSSEMSKFFSVGSGQEVESVRWGSKPELFYCGTDSGNVYCFDVRVGDKPLWTLHAHDSGISSLDINAHVPGMLITAGMNEKVVKLWKCAENSGPSMVLSRDFGVGNVLSAAFAGDCEVAGCMSIGGAAGPLKMWDVLSNRSVRAGFQPELTQLQKKAHEKAQNMGRASRIARKYRNDAETVMTIDAGMDDDDDEEE